MFVLYVNKHEYTRLGIRNYFWGEGGPNGVLYKQVLL